MTLSFGDVTFRGDTRELFRAGVALHLSPKAFDLLTLLLESRPKAVSKTAIIERLWPKTFVTDANLSVLVAEIRAAIGDRPRDGKFIRTVQRFGYAFSGAVVELRDSTPAAPNAHSCWLLSHTSRTPLVNGASIIGRDPHVDIWLDLPGVSRQHARILVNGRHATIADLDSKNGTFVRGERIDAPTEINDGDEIRVGPVALTLRIWLPNETLTDRPDPSGAGTS